MSHKIQQKKPASKEKNEEESDIESDIEFDMDSEVESDIDELDDLDESEALDDKETNLDGDDEDELDEETSNRIKHSAAYLAKVVREITIVPPALRRTSECMTMAEYTMVIGTRATHISQGAPILVDTTGLTEARDIAIAEIDKKLCPLSISRIVRGQREEWEVNEMTVPTS